MKTIKSQNQAKDLNIDMKIDEVSGYGDFVNYLILKALANIVKYSLYSYEQILSEDYSYDDLYFKVCDNFDIPRTELYSDSAWLQKQLNNNKTKFVRQMEYDIYHVMNV